MPASRAVPRAPMVKPPAPVKGRVFIRAERCKGCRFCVVFCPQKVLAMSKEYNAKGYHYPEVVKKEDCINCTLCTMLCPDYAIVSKPAKGRTTIPGGDLAGANGTRS